MRYEPQDQYCVLTTGFLSEEKLKSLMLLYQPLLLQESINLYMTLYVQQANVGKSSTFEQLAKLLNVSVPQLDKALLKLQEYQLVKCYEKKGKPYSNYIFHLNVPLSMEDFFKVKVFRNLFIKTVGQKDAAMIVDQFERVDSMNLNGYVDVTVPLVHAIEVEEVTEDFVIEDIRPKKSFLENEHIHFDYEAFFASTSALVFPIELRNEENLALIGHLATVNGLSPDTMRLLVKDSVSLSTMTLDTEKLKQKCALKAPDIVDAQDPYALPPKAFLQSKQNGKSVSESDARILESLQSEAHFSNEAINIMIEYILEVSDNRLVKKFVDMVAGEWARDGVISKEDALKEVEISKKKNQSYKNTRQVRKQELPKYYQKMKKQEETPVAETSKKFTREEEEALRRQIKEMNQRMKG